MEISLRMLLDLGPLVINLVILGFGLLYFAFSLLPD